MTRVEKIEEDIRALTPDERSALRAWFQGYESELWDEQIEADAKAGKLDRLAERAVAEHMKGTSKPL